jgi:hypothetical protein
MISNRTKEMTPFIVMDVLEKAHEMERQGIHVIHLEVGEPNLISILPSVSKMQPVRPLMTAIPIIPIAWGCWGSEKQLASIILRPTVYR